MRGKSHYDYYLILATTVVLFVISVICIYGMFYFKLAQVHQLPVAEKVGYMDSMNTVMAPFLIALIVLLGICVPKRLLPTSWLNRFSVILVLLALAASFIWGIKVSLALVLIVSLALQVVVLFMALAGSKELNFEKKGYWVRVGSSLLHLGLILFALDLFFYRYQVLHLILFWITTASALLGMVFCFYAESFSRLVKKRTEQLSDQG
ncbi:MAG: hypothetical protein JRI49_02990 [Deltaproteobacteria bacterium]|nr:hypothetical protein [Deltaproteobacteria bacterium]